MVDIENKVYDIVSTAVKTAYPSASVKSIPDYTPVKFPTVEISMSDNYCNTATRTSGSNENYVNVMFTATVYTNGTQKKKDAKAIIATVSDAMENIGFTRKACVPQIYENDTYRIDARFEATASATTIYRR